MIWKYDKADWFGLSIYAFIGAIYFCIAQDILWACGFALISQLAFERGFRK
jgi:hypothetical protein